MALLVLLFACSVAFFTEVCLARNLRRRVSSTKLYAGFGKKLSELPVKNFVLLTLTHSLTYLLTYLFTHSLTHWFTYSLAHLLTGLLSYLFTFCRMFSIRPILVVAAADRNITGMINHYRWLTYSLTHSFTRSLTHSFTHSLIYSLTTSSFTTGVVVVSLIMTTQPLHHHQCRWCEADFAHSNIKK